MKNSLLLTILIAMLTGCSSGEIDEKLTDEQENLVEQSEEQQTETIIKGHEESDSIQKAREQVQLQQEANNSPERLREIYDKIGGLDKIINDVVSMIEFPIDVSSEDLNYTLGLYYKVNGEHITDNPEDYNKLKEAYWKDMEESGLCHNQFHTESNTDCTNKPDSAFHLVAKYAKDNTGDFSIDTNKLYVYANSSSSSNITQGNYNLYNNGICKEMEGAYTSQGLRIIGCSYSSSKDKISITVQNNSGADLRYIRVEIYGIDSNGQTISSDYTNHGSTIRNGASQTLETYVDYANSYEVKITEATPR